MGFSYHQLIYCKRKFSRIKVGTQKQFTFLSLKKYKADAYKEAPGKVHFPDYENFSDVNKAYENFIQKLMSVIDKFAPFKAKRVKSNSQEWFDWEVLERITLQDKLFKNFRRSKLNIDNKIYNKARKKMRRLILEKKREYFENKLKENVEKPMDLWKTRKSLGLFKKFSVVQTNAIEDNKLLKYDLKFVAQTFAKFYFTKLNLYLRVSQILLTDLI